MEGFNWQRELVQKITPQRLNWLMKFDEMDVANK